jgi:hypothetical protein
MITALLTQGPGRAQSGGTQPDYSDVDDFTNGETHLLRNDDLVATFSYAIGEEGRQVLFSGGTNNSQASLVNYSDNTIIPNGQVACKNPGGCYFDYHKYEGGKPASGRFFNTTRDTTVVWPYQPKSEFANSFVDPYWMIWMDGRTVPVDDSPKGAGVGRPPGGLTRTSNTFGQRRRRLNDDGWR